jgi:hypothetical protein
MLGGNCLWQSNAQTGVAVIAEVRLDSFGLKTAPQFLWREFPPHDRTTFITCLQVPSVFVRKSGHEQ